MHTPMHLANSVGHLVAFSFRQCVCAPAWCECRLNALAHARRDGLMDLVLATSLDLFYYRGAAGCGATIDSAGAVSSTCWAPRLRDQVGQSGRITLRPTAAAAANGTVVRQTLLLQPPPSGALTLRLPAAGWTVFCCMADLSPCVSIPSAPVRFLGGPLRIRPCAAAAAAAGRAVAQLAQQAQVTLPNRQNSAWTGVLVTARQFDLRPPACCQRRDVNMSAAARQACLPCTAAQLTRTAVASVSQLLSPAAVDAARLATQRWDVTAVTANASADAVAFGAELAGVVVRFCDPCLLSGLWVRDCLTNVSGAALRVRGGALSLWSAVLATNRAGQDGGAVQVQDALLAAVDSVARGNSAGLGVGGAVAVRGSSQLRWTNGALSNNSAAQGGGAVALLASCAGSAVHQFDGVAMGGNTVGAALNGGGSGRGSVVAKQATGGGGAIYALQNSVRLRRCTLTGNAAAGDGGAVQCVSGAVEVIECTLANNRAVIDGAGVGGNGGALFARLSTLAVSGSLLVGNTAEQNGGAVMGGLSDLTFSDTQAMANAADSGGSVVMLAVFLAVYRCRDQSLCPLLLPCPLCRFALISRALLH